MLDTDINVKELKIVFCCYLYFVIKICVTVLIPKNLSCNYLRRGLISDLAIFVCTGVTYPDKYPPKLRIIS